jgi:ubiquinone/menaquinone biosynthesis C-methylase UbiE
MTAVGSSECRPSYESGLEEKAAGGVMRPGGLALTARAFDYCAFAPGTDLVDVGCGTGITVEFLRDTYGLNAIGIDPSAVILERGRQRNPDLPLLEGSGEQLPLAAGTMDGIVVECALSVMADKQKALAEFNRILVPGGRLIVTDLYARAATGTGAMGLRPTSCLAGMTTREDWFSVLEFSGFTTELWEDHTPKLTEFVIRMIMEHGSLEPFWQGECGSGNPRMIQDAVKEARPGYFLLVGKKTRELAEGDKHE